MPSTNRWGAETFNRKVSADCFDRPIRYGMAGKTAEDKED